MTAATGVLDRHRSASIVATAFGVAVSASVGTDDASIAAAGSGADAENTINDTTYASIQDGSNVTATATDANAVYVSAQNISSATAKSGAGSLGFSFSPGFSGSLAVGVVEANNNINDDVEAFISDANTRVTSAGGVEVQANSTPTINALGVAVSASITIPVNPENLLEFAASGDGAASTNTIGGKVYADIDSGSTVQANGGAVLVSATNTASINATLGTGALSIGLFGLSVGVSLSTNTVNPDVEAFINDATVTTYGQDVDVTASSTNTITGKAIATSLSTGVAGAGGNATSTDDTTTSAYVTAGSSIVTNSNGTEPSSSSGALNIDAENTGGTVTAECDGGSGGVGSIGVFLATANVGGSTTAYLAAGLTN